MNKQKKHTILNVIIGIATMMLMLIICSIVYEYVIDKNATSEVNSNNEASNNLTKNENESENKSPKEDQPEEDNKEENEYIGQEEKENETGNDEVKTDDEKALDLAKKEWGEDSSVQFSIEEKKSNKYYIAVKSNATVIAWYEVNIDTWEISEFY